MAYAAGPGPSFAAVPNANVTVDCILDGLKETPGAAANTADSCGSYAPGPGMISLSIGFNGECFLQYRTPPKLLIVDPVTNESLLPVMDFPKLHRSPPLVENTAVGGLGRVNEGRGPEVVRQYGCGALSNLSASLLPKCAVPVEEEGYWG